MIPNGISTGSVGYWLERLQASHVHAERAPDRWGEEVIRLVDPDGMLLELIGSKHRDEIQPWTSLRLPPWMEQARPQMEKLLPEITTAAGPG